MAKTRVKTTVRVQDKSAQYMDKVTTGVEGLLKRSGFRIARRAQKSMKLLGVNKMDPRPEPNQFAGKPPGVDTGSLKAFIDVEFLRDGTDTFVVRVGSPLEYSRWLELGAPGRNLQPRPFLRPAYHAEGFFASGYTDPFASRLKKVLEKAGR